MCLGQNQVRCQLRYSELTFKNTERVGFEPTTELNSVTP